MSRATSIRLEAFHYCSLARDDRLQPLHKGVKATLRPNQNCNLLMPKIKVWLSRTLFTLPDMGVVEGCWPFANRLHLRNRHIQCQNLLRAKWVHKHSMQNLKPCLGPSLVALLHKSLVQSYRKVHPGTLFLLVCASPQVDLLPHFDLGFRV